MLQTDPLQLAPSNVTKWLVKPPGPIKLCRYIISHELSP